MGKKAPKAPNPAKVAAAQTESNKETAAYNAALNRINQYSPFGSLTYTQSGVDPETGAPIYSQSVSLSPAMQGLLDSQIGAQQGISDAISGAIGRLPGSAFDPSGIDASGIAQASYERRLGLLQPQFDERAKQLNTMLAERGLPVGSEIYSDEMNRFERARNEALQGAARQAELDALQEHQRQFGNLLTEYNLPYQNLGALMGVSSPVQQPSFQNFAQSASPATDVSGNYWNAYNAQMQQYQNQQNQLMSGLLGLGTLALAPATGGGSLFAGMFGK